MKFFLFSLILLFSIDSFTQSSGSWTLLNPPISPSARSDAAFARISDTEILMFGGLSLTNVRLSDTWFFDLTSGSWTQFNPPNPPTGRYRPRSARASENEVLLFSGLDNTNTALNDTWIFNNSSGSWTQITPATQPNVRADGMMAQLTEN
jgi:hypothetical protein